MASLLGIFIVFLNVFGSFLSPFERISRNPKTRTKYFRIDENKIYFYDRKPREPKKPQEQMKKSTNYVNQTKPSENVSQIIKNETQTLNKTENYKQNEPIKEEINVKPNITNKIENKPNITTNPSFNETIKETVNKTQNIINKNNTETIKGKETHQKPTNNEKTVKIEIPPMKTLDKGQIPTKKLNLVLNKLLSQANEMKDDNLANSIQRIVKNQNRYIETKITSVYTRYGKQKRNWGSISSCYSDSFVNWTVEFKDRRQHCIDWISFEPRAEENTMKFFMMGAKYDQTVVPFGVSGRFNTTSEFVQSFFFPTTICAKSFVIYGQSSSHFTCLPEFGLYGK